MEGIFQLQNDVIISANQSCADLLQLDLKEIIGTSFFKRLKGVDALLFKSVLNRLREKQINEFITDFLLKTKNDGWCYFTVRLDLLNHENNDLSIVCSLKKNKNDLEEVDRQLKISRTYDALLYHTLDGVYLYNHINEEIVDANAAAIKMFKYDNLEDIKGISRLDFIPETSPLFPEVNLHDYTNEHVKRVKLGETFSTKGIFKCKDGSQILVKARVVPTFHRYGEAIIIFHDVTKEVTTRKSLRESEKKYRYIFDNSHEAIVYIDLNSRKVSMCNQNALNLFGVEKMEELSELNVSEVVEVNLNEEIDVEKTFFNLIQEGIEGKKATFSFWLKNKQGGRSRVNTMFISDTSDKKNPKIIVFLRDITSLYEIQQALTSKNKELQKYIASNLELENFAYFASHDLQTPLRSIISFTQLLNRSFNETLTKDQMDYMDFIIQSSRNMKSLVDDLLTYSRVNTTKLSREMIDVNEVIAELCTDLHANIQEKNAIIDYDYVNEKILVDRIKIKQVFQNLLTNAIKFSKKDGQPRVVISFTNRKKEWLFKVSDNGIGIEDEFKDKIFGMFKRLHTSKDYQGTGIGLAVVKKIVEQHDGEIGLESQYMKGSTFWFTISKS